MSNSLAIAAVTATLQKVLSTGVVANLPADVPIELNLGNAVVTTRPPDKARAPNENVNQLNLFLYQAMTNGALRNMDMPGQFKSGETAQPPVALSLFYLLTAYGQDDNDTAAHVLLGQAMRILHDRSVLSPSDIKAALGGNDLYLQIERVRITSQPLSVEEMSKLWTTFQTHYRISAAFQASVVLIESLRSSITPLPVLMRGPGDKGVLVQPSLIPPFPTLHDVTAPNKQPSAQLGDVLSLTGHHLDGDTVMVQFRNAQLQNPIQLAAEPGGTATELTVTLPNDPPNWPAGFYGVAAVITKLADPSTRTTNELSFALAPEITSPLPLSANPDSGGTVLLQLGCKPEVRPGQRVALLLGSREILAKPHPAQTGNLTFEIKSAPLGTHFIRLRVDGVDSLLIDNTQDPPVFLADHQITITP